MLSVSRPSPEACELCGALVEPRRRDGIWQFECRGNHPTGSSLTWTWDEQVGVPPTLPSWERPPPLTSAQRNKIEKDAVTDDLLGPLQALFADECRVVEHGVIEDWLRTQYFAIYKHHVDELGHRMFGPAQGQATASRQRFARALVRLEADGILVHETLPSTGAAWAHDTTISYWHRRDVPATAARWTWAEHRAAAGVSDDWMDDDRNGLTPSPSSLPQP